MKVLYKTQIYNMMLASAIFATVITIAVVGTFRERPGPPIFKSSEEAQETKAEQLPLIEQL